MLLKLLIILFHEHALMKFTQLHNYYVLLLLKDRCGMQKQPWAVKKACLSKVEAIGIHTSK